MQKEKTKLKLVSANMDKLWYSWYDMDQDLQK